MTNHHRGIIFMLLSAVIFALMAALVRGVSVNPYTMVMARFLIGTLVCLGIFATGRDRPRWTSWGWLLGRGIIGGIAVILLYWSIQHVGLGKAQMLSYTYVVLAAVIAVPVLGERLRPLQWGAVLVAMAGVVLLCDLQNLTFRPMDAIALLSALCSADRGDLRDALPGHRHLDEHLLVAVAVRGGHRRLADGDQLAGARAGAVALAAGHRPHRLGRAAHHDLRLQAHRRLQGSLLSLITPVISAVIGVLYFREHFSGGLRDRVGDDPRRLRVHGGEPRGDGPSGSREPRTPRCPERG